MSRMPAITKAEAGPKARALLEGVEKKLGSVPNLLATMANSSAVLEAYLGFSAGLSKGSLGSKVREQIALAVSEANRCQYCLSAHAALGRMAGLSDEEIRDGRRGSSPERRANAALAFARKIVTERGFVSDEDIERVRSAGFDDGAIGEIVGNVALTIFTNYFNHVANTEVDFPLVDPAESPACPC